MWRNKLIFALIVSTTANAATKNDDLPQESLPKDGAFTTGIAVTGHFANSAQPTVSRGNAAPQSGLDDASSLPSASLIA